MGCKNSSARNQEEKKVNQMSSDDKPAAAADAPSTSQNGLPTVVLVTGNKGKLKEIQAILEGVANVENVPLDLTELQGASMMEISAEKGRTAFTLLRRPLLIEDTSLCFNAINGLPGPYVKWFYDKIGNDGLVKMLHAYDDKSAFASCIFTYCDGAGSSVHSFDGRCHGKIVDPRGASGFGWDPVFEPVEGGGLTFAEMDPAEKNKISHRFKALQLVKEFFAATKEESVAKKARPERRDSI